jgi:hypothetical protein
MHGHSPAESFVSEQKLCLLVVGIQRDSALNIARSSWSWRD